MFPSSDRYWCRYKDDCYPATNGEPPLPFLVECNVPCRHVFSLVLLSQLQQDVIGCSLHGTWTALPWIAFCPPLGSPTSFMKGMCWLINLNSSSLKSFSSGEISCKAKPFAHDCMGTCPFLSTLWQVLHIQDFPWVCRIGSTPTILYFDLYLYSASLHLSPRKVRSAGRGPTARGWGC